MYRLSFEVLQVVVEFLNVLGACVSSDLMQSRDSFELVDFFSLVPQHSLVAVDVFYSLERLLQQSLELWLIDFTFVHGYF